jgi:hypothetical protein
MAAPVSRMLLLARFAERFAHSSVSFRNLRGRNPHGVVIPDENLLGGFGQPTSIPGSTPGDGTIT